MDPVIKSFMSLKLASAIFGEEVNYVDESVLIKKSGKFVRIVGETFSEDFETSYLALSKCKFWANEILGLQKGFQMNSSQTWLGGAPCSKITVEKRDGEIVFESHFVNEVEGIIKASEWILNENS